MEISNIPFPAVTYCPEVKTDYQKFEYDTVVDALKSGNMTIDDLSEDE